MDLFNREGGIIKSKYSLEEIDNKKSILGVGSYKKIELKYIKEKELLTQLRTSDRQIRNISDKVRKVQDEMKKYKFI